MQDIKQSPVSHAATKLQNRDVLIYVFLRGGMDGLSFCVPHGDDDYYKQRARLAIPKPRQTNGALDLDGFFGLAPAASALLPLFRSGELAIVPAAGSPFDIRSHFEAMLRIESASPDATQLPPTNGWIGRFLQRQAPRVGRNLRGLVLDPVMPRSFAGAPASLPVYDPSNFSFHGRPGNIPARMRTLRAMYASAPQALRAAAQSSLDVVDLMSKIDFGQHKARNGAQYPATEFGRKMKEAAAALVLGAPVEVVEVDLGAWDDHDDMGPQSGKLALRMQDLAEGLAAFAKDCGRELTRATVVVMSEFGRRVDENGSGGTDHGRAGCMLVLGKNVRGGRIHGRWPGLSPAAMDDLALRVTTDWRDVMSEVLTVRCGLREDDLALVFPGHRRNAVGIVS